MPPNKYLQNVVIATVAAVLVGAPFVHGTDESGSVGTAAGALVGDTVSTPEATGPEGPSRSLATETKVALGAFAALVRPLSHPQALADAFESYFAFKAAHPDEVKKPYLYFVDYGLPSTTPRGYVFDMAARTIVDGPFTVAHGRGSSKSQYGIPTRFSNAFGSAASSLGLFLAKETYAFRGTAGGRLYSSIGLKLMGLSAGFNDNALARRVVAHGAPYVTPARAGRSEGCPAMEQSRARRLLPKLADGSLVFLFSPDPNWMAGDPWLAANAG